MLGCQISFGSVLSTFVHITTIRSGFQGPKIVFQCLPTIFLDLAPAAVKQWCVIMTEFLVVAQWHWVLEVFQRPRKPRSRLKPLTYCIKKWISTPQVDPMSNHHPSHNCLVDYRQDLQTCGGSRIEKRNAKNRICVFGWDIWSDGCIST